ncbi:MAG: endo-1,4-beta-xylanase [Gemmatimonadales bacterium]
MIRDSRRVLRASRLLPAVALLLSTGAAGAQASLKAAFAGDFRVGAALSPKQFDERDADEVALVKRQFNTITPENVLKWESVHPQPGRYEFGPSDAYVAFGTRNGMFVVGHTLVWHSQTPRWVFQDSAGKPLTRDALLARLRDHIRTVVGRYKGRIGGWDVVNEVVDEDGALRKSPWQRIIGDDYIAKAFQFAHEADPAAQLYYNDYSLENPVKRAGAVALVKSLLAQGVPITGVGLQGHHKLDWPSAAAEDSTIAAFAALGVRVNVSELDIDVLPRATRQQTADVAARADSRAGLDPYAGALPDSVQRTLADRYAAMFAVYLKHRDVMDRITFWGVTDADSWLNDWPVRGRTNHPLLFDRQGRPKPAFDSVIALARTGASIP